MQSLVTEVYISLRTRNMVLDPGTLTQIPKEPLLVCIQSKKWEKLGQSCFEFNFQTDYEQALLMSESKDRRKFGEFKIPDIWWSTIPQTFGCSIDATQQQMALNFELVVSDQLFSVVLAAYK